MAAALAPTARRHLARALLLALAGVVPAVPRADETERAEYRIKAAFLCKFGHYVEWPGGPPGGAGQPFGIGVLGPAPVRDELHAAARGQAVLGRPIAIVALERDTAYDELAIVFVARSHAGELPRVREAIAQRPILLVTEAAAGSDAPAGSVIHFVVDDDKVRFDIALAPASGRGLKISARLLRVARQVSGAPS